MPAAADAPAKCSTVALPTAVARMRMRPPWLTVPPMRVSPARLGTGAASPVAMLSSTVVVVAPTRTPSVGIELPAVTCAREAVSGRLNETGRLLDGVRGNGVVI